MQTEKETKNDTIESSQKEVCTEYEQVLKGENFSGVRILDVEFS